MVMANRSKPTLAAMFAVGAAAALCSAFYEQLSFVGSSKAVPLSVGLAPTGVDQRSSGVSRNAVDILLKQRITAVKKTSKITDAMRMMAAAKVRKAQDGTEKTRPFSKELQGMIKGIVKKLKGTGLEQELPMLRVAEEIKGVAILTLTSSRGLCGGYNALIVKRLRRRVDQLNEQGIVPKLVFVGKKGRRMTPGRLRDSKFEMLPLEFEMPDTMNAKISTDVGEAVKNIFLGGEVDKVEIVYAKFVNLLTNQPTVRTILPLSPTGIEDPEDETFKMTTVDGKLSVEKSKLEKVEAKEIENDVIFDQTPEAILNSMLPLYLNSQLLSLLWESQASELGARMMAMKAATDNAKEMVKKLEIVYNRKRQAAITAEIAEISSGAMAVDEMVSNKDVSPLGVLDSDASVTEELLTEIEDSAVPDEPQFAWEKYPEEWWAGVTEAAPVKGAKL